MPGATIIQGRPARDRLVAGHRRDPGEPDSDGVDPEAGELPRVAS